MSTNILTPFDAEANLMPGRRTFVLLLWLIETSKKVLFSCIASFSTMDPARIEGTLWNVLYYFAGAVNRFLRAEPSNLISNDPLQESTAGSDSGGDACRCKDPSDEAVSHLTASPPARDGDEKQNAAVEEAEQLNDPAEEPAATFCSVAYLNLMEKTTVSRENSSGPKMQDMSSDSLSTANGQSGAMTGELSKQVGKVEAELFRVDKNDSCKEAASALPVKMPLSACDVLQQPQTPTSEEPLPVHNNEAFPDGKKAQGFLEVEGSEEMQTHGHLQEEVEILQNSSAAEREIILAEETTAACASSKMGVKRPEQESDAAFRTDDLEQGIEVFEQFEQALWLGNAAGDHNEARRETKEWILIAADVEGDLTESSTGKEEMKPNDADEDGERETDVEKVNKMLKDAGTTLDLTATRKREETALSSVGRHQDAIPETSFEDNLDSKQNKIANESLEKQYDTESFIEISTLELGFSDESFEEAQTAAKAATILKTDSELRRSGSEASLQELAKDSGEPLKTKNPESEAEASGFVLNFASQKSRIAVKNPRARPPKDRHSLLLRPSVEPDCAPTPLAPKIPVGVHVLGGLGFGFKLPGLGSGFPVVKKLSKMQQEAQLKPVPKVEETKEAEAPQKPKWMPPRQTGFGNPFISELKTKLKKATKN
ncbi:uncharacterized protein LOC144038293 [Vanacampus margaritifer]